jgi:hypothetical protein
MKIISYLSLFFLITISCSAQGKKYSLKKIKMKMSEINSKKKSIDITVLHKYKNELESNSGNSNAASDSSLKKQVNTLFYKSHDGSDIIDEYNDKKEKIKETKLRTDGKVEINEKVDDYFTYNETYSQSGDIERKSISSKLGFEVGMKYLFGAKGKLTKSINTDEGYSFTFEDVFKFCREKKMSFETTSFPFRIYKTTRPVDNVKLWVIEYPDEEKRKLVTYVLDGAKGKVLNKMENDWPEFKHGQ